MAFPKPTARDPRSVTSVGSYLTDGIRLVWVLSVDARDAVTECAKTGDLITIGPIDLLQKWRTVTPL